MLSLCVYAKNRQISFCDKLSANHLHMVREFHPHLQTCGLQTMHEWFSSQVCTNFNPVANCIVQQVLFATKLRGGKNYCVT